MNPRPRLSHIQIAQIIEQNACSLVRSRSSSRPLWVNNPTLTEFCFGMIGVVSIIRCLFPHRTSYLYFDFRAAEFSEQISVHDSLLLLSPGCSSCS